jgi:hypothetical protein
MQSGDPSSVILLNEKYLACDPLNSPAISGRRQMLIKNFQELSTSPKRTENRGQLLNTENRKTENSIPEFLRDKRLLP